MRALGPAAVLIIAAAGLGCEPRENPRLVELREILASRNDNDPRLDKDFDALSPSDIAAFKKEYASLPRERRNERGTIVYLLGRNAKTPEDWSFIARVAAEPPCLSLDDCGKLSPGALQPGDAVTLAYPSLVAMKIAQRALEELGQDKPEVRAVFAAGAGSEAPAAAALGRQLSARYPRK